MLAAGQALDRFPRLAGGVVTLVGAVVLLGWACHIEALKCILPGAVSMKANTAACFVLLGASLYMLPSGASRWAPRSIAAASGLIAALSLSQDVFGVDLGIDQWLVRDHGRPPLTQIPGRMAPATAACFLLCAASVCLTTARARLAVLAAQVTSVAVIEIAWMALLGYAYQVPELRGLLAQTQLAIHTAGAFLLAGLGLLFARPREAACATLIDPGPGGVFARRLLPATLLIPTVLGWLRLEGQRANLYGAELGLSLLVTSVIVVFVGVVWWVSGSLVRVERAKREAEVRSDRGEAQLQTLVESLDDIVFTLDRDCRHLALLGRWQARYGVEASTYVGRKATEILGEEEGREHEEQARRALAGESVTYEWGRVHLGRRLDIQTTLSPIRGASGEIVGVVGVGRDVTRLKQLERRLATQHETTRILAEAPDLQDAGPRILEAVCVRLGWALGELWRLGPERTHLDCVCDWGDMTPSGRTFKEASRGLRLRVGQSVPGDVWERRAPVWCEDVTVCRNFVRKEAALAAGFHSLCGVPVQADGGFAGVLLVLSRDRLLEDQGMIDLISSVGRQLAQFVERREAQGAVQRKEEQLRQSQRLEAIGQLAAGVAHDFNNLLTAIIGYSELTLARLPLDDVSRREIAEVKRAGERAAALTRQLLAFSRKQVLQPRVIDLNEVVHEMEKLLRRVIGDAVDLAVVPCIGLWKVEADPAQMEQVVLNLAVNARDAIADDGSVTIETRNVDLADTGAHLDVAPGPYVMLAVSDNGHGMDAETKARIFEPFFTTKGVGKGTGLGLATVYGIVKQSGGHIWVYSEPGIGTTFKVYLPRTTRAQTDTGKLPSTEPVPSGTETVLLVEDNELALGSIAGMLRRLGYRVVTADSPAQALREAAAVEGTIHVLVTDVVMPGLSGRQLYEQLRASRPNLWVLYISGYTDNAIVHHGVLDEGTPFLQKPFGPGALARRLREVLTPRA